MEANPTKFQGLLLKGNKHSSEFIVSVQGQEIEFSKFITARDYNAVLSKCGVYSFRISSLKAMAVEIHKILRIELTYQLSNFSFSRNFHVLLS